LILINKQKVYVKKQGLDKLWTAVSTILRTKRKYVTAYANKTDMEIWLDIDGTITIKAHMM